MPETMTLRHFLSLLDVDAQEADQLIERASKLKHMQRHGTAHALFPNKVLGMVFEKPSTRTRVSFEAGMAQLGGRAIFLSPNDTQLGRGEPIADSARVISSMVDILMVRTSSHTKLQEFADHSAVPVINALTDYNHPCQLLADVQTFSELRGAIQGRTVAWLGDGNNMCNSYIEAAAVFDFELRIATPLGFEPNGALCAQHADRLTLLHDPAAAVRNADLVTTDTWIGMGQEQEKQQRAQQFALYQVNAELMAQAKPDALFLHCLPAYRGQEVSAEVIDGPQSGVGEQAENRLHAQKALIELLLQSSQR